MRYFMPTIVLSGEDVVKNNKDVFKSLGRRALIVSGKYSAKKNGSLSDVTAVLNELDIVYTVFDEIQENPPIHQCLDGAKIASDCDFVIGIGGGSAMDTAKAVALLIKCGSKDYQEKLFGDKDYPHLPVVAIPTTCGTGSEVTPYSIFTDFDKETKVGMARRIFPKYALIDAKYFMTMPRKVRDSTIADAYTHALESYINVKSNPYSELFSMEAMRIFGEYRTHLFADTIDAKVLGEFVRASSFAGIAISQTGTSIPHGLGYPITYHYNMPHGFANAMFLEEYLRICPKDKVAKVLELSRFDSIAELGAYFKNIICSSMTKIDISYEEIARFTKELMANEKKLANHPDKLSYEQVFMIYKESFHK